MNPVVWFLVLLAAFVLWLAISFVFIPVGRLISKKTKEISDIINYEDTSIEKKENDSE